MDHGSGRLPRGRCPPCGWGQLRENWAYQYRHINVHGHYSFALPDLGGNHRPLRDPDAPGEE